MEKGGGEVLTFKDAVQYRDDTQVQLLKQSALDYKIYAIPEEPLLRGKCQEMFGHKWLTVASADALRDWLARTVPDQPVEGRLAPPGGSRGQGSKGGGRQSVSHRTKTGLLLPAGTCR